jgi:hypothetical protein
MAVNFPVESAADRAPLVAEALFCYFVRGLATFDLSPGQTALSLTSNDHPGPSGSEHVT